MEPLVSKPLHEGQNKEIHINGDEKKTITLNADAFYDKAHEFTGEQLLNSEIQQITFLLKYFLQQVNYEW